MPRVTHVKAAQKDYPDQGIAKGESYYWWKFRYGGKHFSKTPPKASQLTQSPFLLQLYTLQEQMENLQADSTLPDEVSSIVDSLRELADECQSSKDNMPEGLQQGSTGEMLEARVDSCNSAADELEAIDLSEFEPAEGEEDKDDPVNDDGETEEEYWDSKLSEVKDITLEAE